MIPVSRPSLPRMADVAELMRDAWQSGMVANCAALVPRLERELAQRWGTSGCVCVSSGTAALQLALETLDIHGEVVTTPYSFVATAHAIRLAGAVPVFADVDPHTGNIDPDAVEAAITPRTTAILAVHVYGVPCNHDRLRAIADRHGLALVYDAAHAFGVTYSGSDTMRAPVSAMALCDASAISFHATKPFTTTEGGAVVFADHRHYTTAMGRRSFGRSEKGEYTQVAGNAKMSEIHAAIGICNLRTVGIDLARRRDVQTRYLHRLRNVLGIATMPPSENAAYMPVLIEPGTYGETRDHMALRLAGADIATRPYFAPIIPAMPAYDQEGEWPNARRLAACVLCLPMYADLPLASVDYICDTITNPGGWTK